MVLEKLEWKCDYGNKRAVRKGVILSLLIYLKTRNFIVFEKRLYSKQNSIRTKTIKLFSKATAEKIDKLCAV